MRFPIDVRSDRLALQQIVTLLLETGANPLDKVELDTGLAYGLMGPEDSALLPERPRRGKLRPIGDNEIKGVLLEGSLRFEDYDLPDRITIFLHKRIDHWTLGLPVLRHFHLLLPAPGWMLTPDERLLILNPSYRR